METSGMWTTDNIRRGASIGGEYSGLSHDVLNSSTPNQWDGKKLYEK
jgi:hypothetical protein